MRPLELWAGLECTISRVGSCWQSQLERSGHLARPTDLELIAELGIRTLRYPVLWEQHALSGPGDESWRWTQERLHVLRAFGIAPIVGLIHHGSGPAHTSLIEEGFAPGLADHARRTAELFPWIEQYTPVNEPLTTARFSGLYGHWYPHGRDNETFARALMNQCRATVLSMRAIRVVNSDARLIQTEDLGTTYGTAHMQDQVAFDNDRRWLTWDVLCGRVTAQHPMWQFLRSCGISSRELGWFADNPCPPQIIGVNHYVTSDRFLDHNTARYPQHTHGSNGRDCYADVDAVRALRGRYRGWDILEQAARRYTLPIAVTEVHLGCSREEQLRWLEDAWTACQEARAQGRNVRAVTAWALFGSFDWDSLLTRSTGHYEVGAFDVRAPQPRPTAISHRIRQLANGTGDSGHPVLASDGWWQTRRKFSHGPPFGADPQLDTIGSARHSHATRQPLVICGAGSLGRALSRECARRGLDYRLFGRGEVDICDRAALERTVADLRPWAVINAAGYVQVDDAESNVTQCFQENCEGPRLLAEVLHHHNVALVTFSTDLVFDGTKNAPYTESDIPHPLNAYGRSKAAGETAVLECHPGALCIRTAAFFGYWEGSDYLASALDLLDIGRPVRATSDIFVSPTYLPDLVGAALDLLIDGTTGLWHLANAGIISWADFVRRAASLTGVNASALEVQRTADAGYEAARPRNSALASERAWVMRSLDAALHEFAEIARGTFLPRQRSLRAAHARRA